MITLLSISFSYYFFLSSPFFLPYGTRIFNKLVDLMKNECKKRGFKEVITPLIFDETLWKTVFRSISFTFSPIY